MELLRDSERIIFLGDSITQGGHYITIFDAWLQTQDLEQTPKVINVGLSSETVSGLSEEGHAGGRFPRPDLFERLDRVLEKTQPDLIIACYGINCGIYQPLDEERFRAYREGMERLRAKAEAIGAAVIHVTPPCYDDQQRPKEFSYDAVMDRYSQYLLEGRTEGHNVVDLHGEMVAELAERRKTDPRFTFQNDAVHPNAEGHWIMARAIIRWFGDDQAAAATSPEAMLEAKGVSPELLKPVGERMNLLRSAYVSAAGHLRPGVRPGLPLDEAEAKAKELTEMIQEQLKGQE